MNVERLRALCTELYKTTNKLNPNLRSMGDLSKLRLIIKKYGLKTIISKFKQVSDEKKSLRIFDPQLTCRIILNLLKI